MRRRLPPSAISLYSVEFDGVNDYVVAGNNSSFNYYHGATNPTGFAFSISVWVKFVNPNADALQVIFDNCNVTTANVGITLAVDSRTLASRTRAILALIYRAGVGGTTVVQHISANNVYPNSTGWIHILWTYNQALASANSNIYINNVLASTANKNVQPPVTSNAYAALRFGYATGNRFPMKGKQYNQLFINKVLDATERAELYNNPNLAPFKYSFAPNITHAYGFPNGKADFPTMTNFIGGVNGTMTNQVVNNITPDIP